MAKQQDEYLKFLQDVFNGDIPNVERILNSPQANRFVNKKDQHNRTPLIIAVRKGHSKLILPLVAKGASLKDVDENEQGCP